MGKGSKKYLLSLLLLGLFSGQVYGQQAPSGHAEVWQNVQSYWDLWAKKDLNGFLQYHHDGYSGWDAEDPMHKNKESVKEWLGHTLQTKEIVVFNINPIDIKIHDNVAIVHYYYSILEKSLPQNKEIKRTGRRTDVLKKQVDKWVVIASHGGDSCEK